MFFFFFNCVLLCFFFWRFSVHVQKPIFCISSSESIVLYDKRSVTIRKTMDIVLLELEAQEINVIENHTSEFTREKKTTSQNEIMFRCSFSKFFEWCLFLLDTRQSKNRRSADIRMDRKGTHFITFNNKQWHLKRQCWLIDCFCYRCMEMVFVWCDDEYSFALNTTNDMCT